MKALKISTISLLLETLTENFVEKKNSEYISQQSFDLVELSKRNPKAFWKKIKRKKKTKTGNCDFDLYFKNLFESNNSNLSVNTYDILQASNLSRQNNEDIFLYKDID